MESPKVFFMNWEVWHRNQMTSKISKLSSMEVNAQGPECKDYFSFTRSGYNTAKPTAPTYFPLDLTEVQPCLTWKTIHNIHIHIKYVHTHKSPCDLFSLED